MSRVQFAFEAPIEPKQYQLARLAEYHIHIAATLQGDLDAGEAGFRAELNDPLCALYRTEDWREAYAAAIRFHRDRWAKCLEALGAGDRAAGERIWLAVYDRHEIDFWDWIQNRLSLGTEPAWQAWRLGPEPAAVAGSEPTLCTCPRLAVVQAGCKCGGT